MKDRLLEKWLAYRCECAFSDEPCPPCRAKEIIERNESMEDEAHEDA